MSLQTWWIGTRLRRVEAKLKRLHVLQRDNRRELEKLEAQKRKGMKPGEYEAQHPKLESVRERLTHEVARWKAEEERLGAELKAAAAVEENATT